jgi:hypothetical protein
LNRRTHPNPEAIAIWLIGNAVSSISFFTKCNRRVRATALGVAPKCFKNNRLRCRDPTPNRSASSSTPPSSSPLSSINRKARDTVVEVPIQAGVPGEASGRQRRHGRNPASAAAAALAKYRQFFSFAVGAGQIGRQYTMLPTTPIKNFPSNRASRESLARLQTCISNFMFRRRTPEADRL